MFGSGKTRSIRSVLWEKEWQNLFCVGPVNRGGLVVELEGVEINKYVLLYLTKQYLIE